MVEDNRPRTAQATVGRTEGAGLMKLIRVPLAPPSLRTPSINV